MMKGGKKIEDVTTAQELIEALKQFPGDTPLHCNMEDIICVHAWHDYDSNELQQIDIEGQC